MADYISLKDEIASALSCVKAYDLPTVAESFGIEEGDESESYKSKFKYVFRRIDKWANEELLDLAKKVQGRYPSDSLQRCIEQLDASMPFAMSEITRRAIFKKLDEFEPVNGDLGIIEFMERLWPVHAMPASSYTYYTAAVEIEQHMVLNDDYSFSLMLELLKLDSMSNSKLVELLELAVDPLVRRDDPQTSFIEGIGELIQRDGLRFVPSEPISGYPAYRIDTISDGVQGNAKNLIFAAIGLKPEIVLKDAINNDLEIVKHKDNCLIYDLPISGLDGLSWKQLKEWYFGKQNWDDNEDSERDFYRRLRQSIPENSPGEYLIFKTYFGAFRSEFGESLPALIPQVYLHYDPYTARQLDQKRLERQRMDFLLLLPSSARVVIEVDGKHHYADSEKPSPKKYSEMISADRDLRLAGYEVYRFGGFEFMDDETGKELIIEFFQSLFQKHRVPKRPLPDAD